MLQKNKKLAKLNSMIWFKLHVSLWTGNKQFVDGKAVVDHNENSTVL